MSSYWKRFSVLSFLGFVISSYLIFHYTAKTRGFQSEKSFCSISAVMDCDSVAESSWASFLGVPVAGWALAYYLVFLVLVWLRTRGDSSERDEETADLFLAFSSLALIPSIFLLGISHFVIGKYCLMCLLLDVTNILLFTIAALCPARTKSLFASFANGLRTFFRDLFNFSTPGALAPGLVLWATVFIGVCSSGIIPDLLVQFYFLPKRAAGYDREMLRPLVEQWKIEHVQPLELKASADPVEKDFSLGRAGAPVQVVTFSDFECPFCKKTAAYLRPFMDKYAQDFQLVFKNYPLDHSCNARIPKPKHEFSCRVAAMARCAGAQGDQFFWKMHDLLMDLASYDEQVLAAVVAQSGVQQEAFNACVQDAKPIERIKADITDGDRVGVFSTPTVLINGRKVQVAPNLLPGLLLQILETVKAERKS